MKKKIFLKILIGVVLFAALIKFLTIVSVEPWVRAKTEAILNGKTKEYIVEINKVHVSIIPIGVELKKITISTRLKNGDKQNLNGEIASIKLRGINLIKAIFKKDIYISIVSISGINLKGKIPFPGKSMPPLLSPLNISIDKVFFDKINISLANIANPEAYSIKEGILKLYGLQAEKNDTLSPSIIKELDFESEELKSVPVDSMYTYKTDKIIYSSRLKTLAIENYSINPNYTKYDFTARYKSQTDCIEAVFSNIFFHDFTLAGYIRSGNLISSYIEIGKIDINVFRDKRKEFLHVIKPEFQDLIYKYPGVLDIDSICILEGSVTYTEQAVKASEPGKISFTDTKAKIYKITNDTLYKTKNGSLEFKVEALLMGKSKLTIAYKAKLFSNINTSYFEGALSGLEGKELNPMLENNAFVYITSGKIERMDFNYTADKTKSTGRMTLIYKGLYLVVKNKQTDDTTSFKERFISFILNKKVMDSNPLPGKEVRIGSIDYERDPEKSSFNYLFNSILTGIKSSIVRNPNKK